MNPRDAHALGLLLRFALTRRLRPAENPDYRRLVERLQRDGAFANSFGELADGMGLIVLSTDDYGVVLGCRDDSPFSMRLTDFRTSMKSDDRVLYGLILLTIASWCFPRASELDDYGEGVRRLSVPDVTGHLIELSERLAESADQDAAADHPELRQAWRIVLEGAASKPTVSGRRTSTTLAGRVKYTLQKLAEHGLLVPDGDDKKESFKTTRAFRTQLRDLTANEAFALVRAASAVDEGL